MISRSLILDPITGFYLVLDSEADYCSSKYLLILKQAPYLQASHSSLARKLFTNIEAFQFRPGSRTVLRIFTQAGSNSR